MQRYFVKYSFVTAVYVSLVVKATMWFEPSYLISYAVIQTLHCAAVTQFMMGRLNV